MNFESTANNSSQMMGESIDLATWNIPRSIEQLRAFVTSRDEALDVAEFDI